MKIKGILFDKDGTLIDFFSLWKPASETVIHNILEINNIGTNEKLVQELLLSIGVENNYIDPRGALAYKTYKDIAMEFYKVMIHHCYKVPYDELSKQVQDLYDLFINGDNAVFKEICNLKALFSRLKNENIKLGLATADTPSSTLFCLNKLGVTEYFDFIGTDDGIMKPKPNTDICDEFCRKFDLKANEIAIVGDTPNDMLFARKCKAIAIGVLSGVSKRDDLDTDTIIPTVEFL